MKFKTLQIVLILVLFSTLSAYENTYYLSKVSLFKALKNNKNAKIMMLGDSITDRGLWNELTQREDIVNRGINGDTTEGLLHRLNALNPYIKKAYIMIGVNDILIGKKISKIFSNYVKIIHTLQSQNITPIVESTLYVVKGTPPLYNKKIKKLNQLLKDYASKNNLKFLDLNTRLSPNGYLDKRYSLDGLHLNGKGYLIWARVLNGRFDS